MFSLVVLAARMPMLGHSLVSMNPDTRHTGLSVRLATHELARIAMYQTDRSYLHVGNFHSTKSAAFACKSPIHPIENDDLPRSRLRGMGIGAVCSFPSTTVPVATYACHHFFTIRASLSKPD